MVVLRGPNKILGIEPSLIAGKASTLLVVLIRWPLFFNHSFKNQAQIQIYLFHIALEIFVFYFFVEDLHLISSIYAFQFLVLGHCWCFFFSGSVFRD